MNKQTVMKMVVMTRIKGFLVTLTLAALVVVGFSFNQKANAIFTLGIGCIFTDCNTYGTPDSRGFAGAFLCAPEVAKSNLESVNAELSALAQSKEFKNAVYFKKRINDIQALSTPTEQASAYFKDIGVKSDQEVVDLLGARSISNIYITNLERNMSLTNDQALKVADTLLKLKGSLQ